MYCKKFQIYTHTTKGSDHYLIFSIPELEGLICYEIARHHKIYDGLFNVCKGTKAHSSTNKKHMIFEMLMQLYKDKYYGQPGDLSQATFMETTNPCWSIRPSPTPCCERNRTQ